MRRRTEKNLGERGHQGSGLPCRLDYEICLSAFRIAHYRRACRYRIGKSLDRWQLLPQRKPVQRLCTSKIRFEPQSYSDSSPCRTTVISEAILPRAIRTSHLPSGRWAVSGITVPSRANGLRRRALVPFGSARSHDVKPFSHIPASD